MAANKIKKIISSLIRSIGSLDYSIESMWFSMMDGFDFDPCAIYLLRVNKQQYVVFTKKTCTLDAFYILQALVNNESKPFCH